MPEIRQTVLLSGWFSYGFVSFPCYDFAFLPFYGFAFFLFSIDLLFSSYSFSNAIILSPFLSVSMKLYVGNCSPFIISPGGFAPNCIAPPIKLLTDCSFQFFHHRVCVSVLRLSLCVLFLIYFYLFAHQFLCFFAFHQPISVNGHGRSI